VERHSRLPALLPSVLIDGCTMLYSASVKNLGLAMDNRFSWRDQINCDRRNVFFVLSTLWNFADVKPIIKRERLVQNLL
jgi:hypothetical protein